MHERMITFSVSLHNIYLIPKKPSNIVHIYQDPLKFAEFQTFRGMPEKVFEIKLRPDIYDLS